MNVAVVGGGRMGLPLACILSDNGADVTVCDIDMRVVEALNAGAAPYDEPGLAAYVARCCAANRLRATTQTQAAAAESDVVIVIVPAHLTPERDIDYTVLQSASVDVGRGLKPGALVSYETTVAVGGTRNMLVPLLETRSGLRVGTDFQVAFSPERVKANRVFEKLQKTPKVVGGYDAASAETAERFYGAYLGAPVINVGSLEAAEFTKLAGMVYRDVNIALANELAAYAEALGLDFAPVRDAANTNGEANLLVPGIGVGGHCTPVYPHFVIQDARRKGLDQELAAAARKINDCQPGRYAARLAAFWPSLEKKRVHIMGLAFRPDVRVHTLSPAFSLQEALLGAGAVVTLEDPLYTDDEVRGAGFAPARAGRDALDAVLLVTAHAAFASPDFRAWRATGIEVVVDGRRCWDRQTVEAAGIAYLGAGMGRL